jgi:hypothetical protein
MKDMAANRAVGEDAMAGDRRLAGPAGPAAKRYEVRPVAWGGALGQRRESRAAVAVPCSRS